MEQINVSYYKNRAHQKKKSLAAFLRKLLKRNPPHLLKSAKKANQEVWQEINCIACANCCKIMTPTWKKSEIKRVAQYVGMDYTEYYEKYITVDEDNGDLINKNTPCQHLNLRTNMCKIYEVRPRDCRHFPHLVRKDFTDQAKMYIDNLHRCPATLRFIEKLEMAMNSF